MDFKEIKGIKHYLFDNLKEFKAFYPKLEVSGNWRDSRQNDWAYTDDMQICQILKRSNIYDDFSQKNKTLIRTVCGTYIAERANMKMIGADGIPANIYAFSKTFKSHNQYVKNNKKETKEMLFAKYVAKGSDIVSAFKKVYKNANNKSYISKKTNELLNKKSVRKMIDENIKEILQDEGVSSRWIVQEYKRIISDSRRDSDKLRSLEALSKIAGLFNAEKKTEQVTVWGSHMFNQEQQELLNGEKPKLLAHEEKEE
tara:strand:+ start:156 stop:923 length:768 start_codon:yes stop_codon:yes gene_type:complete